MAGTFRQPLGAEALFNGELFMSAPGPPGTGWRPGPGQEGRRAFAVPSSLLRGQLHLMRFRRQKSLPPAAMTLTLEEASYTHSELYGDEGGQSARLPSAALLDGDMVASAVISLRHSNTR